jgi:hypothetical protein
MANVIKVYVETPDEILDPLHSGAGAVVQLQRATDQAFTTPADVATEPIVSQVRAYTIFDPGGDSSSWYRTRYETSGGVATSDWSTAFQVGIVGYCSLEDVKQRLQRTDDTVDDELFAEYVDEATDFIRGYIGHDLIDTGTVYTFDGHDAIHGGRCLLVPRGVRSLSAVETAPSTGAAFETVTASLYFLRPTTQERTPGWPATELWLSDQSGMTFPRGYDNVRLTGTFGFSPIPRRIEEVALNLVVRMYASRQAGQADLIGAGGDGGQPLVSSFLSRRDRETLDKFTPMLVA